MKRFFALSHEKKSLIMVVLVIVGNILVFGTAWLLAPEAEEVDLILFHGRVLPAHEVHSGTFSVAKKFNDALLWDKDAILTYDQNSIEVWRPDESTSGVFQYARKDLSSLFYIGHPQPLNWAQSSDIQAIRIRYGLDFNNFACSLGMCLVVAMVFFVVVGPQSRQS